MRGIARPKDGKGGLGRSRRLGWFVDLQRFNPKVNVAKTCAKKPGLIPGKWENDLWKWWVSTSVLVDRRILVHWISMDKR